MKSREQVIKINEKQLSQRQVYLLCWAVTIYEIVNQKSEFDFVNFYFFLKQKTKKILGRSRLEHDI